MLKVDDSEVFRGLSKLADTLDNPAPLLNLVAGLVERSIEANFAAEGRPRWAPLAAATLKRKRGQKILQETGAMAASITIVQVSTNAIAVGSPLDRAFVHQYGTVSIPARPIVQLVDAEIKEIAGILQRWASI